MVIIKAYLDGLDYPYPIDKAQEIWKAAEITLQGEKTRHWHLHGCRGKYSLPTQALIDGSVHCGTLERIIKIGNNQALAAWIRNQQ
jgi:hypothetical protein